MKEVGVIQAEPLQVTLAARPILALADLEEQRAIDRPALLTAITLQELLQFKRDHRFITQRYDGFVAGVTRIC